MPVLTDQKDWDDDKPPENPDEPPEYALRYLFNGANNPHEDLQRMARILIVTGAVTNLIGFVYLLGNYELVIHPLLWVLEPLIIGLGLVAWRQIWGLHHRHSLLNYGPLFIVVASLIAQSIFYTSLNGVDAIVAALPGSLVLVVGEIMLVRLKSRNS
jgi:hypothetical protein